MRAGLLAGAVAFLVVLWGTRGPGPGLSTDALSYLGAAQSLVSRGTLEVPTGLPAQADTTKPLVIFPPGLPLLLAMPMAVGVSPTQSARLLDALAAACVIAIIVVMTVRWTTAGAGEAPSTRTLWGLVAGAAALATPWVLNDFLWVWSEPVFLAFTAGVLAGMLGMWTAVRRKTDAGNLVALGTGLLAGAAMMTRYVGLALVGVATFWALMIPGTVRQRVIRAVITAAPGTLAFGLWEWRLASVKAGPIREITAYGTPWRKLLRPVGGALAHWLFPGTAAAFWIAAITVVVIVAMTLLSIRVARSNVLLVAVGSLIVGYLGLVVFAALFADPDTALDGRLLSPVFLFASMAFVVAVAARWSTWRRPLRWGVGSAIGLWLIASGIVSAQRLQDVGRDPYNLESVAWQQSPTVQWLQHSATDRVLYTSQPAPVYFLAHRGSRAWPWPAAMADSAVRGRIMTLVARDRALVVAFANDEFPGMLSDSLAAAYGLRIVARFSDGAIWQSAIDPPPPSP